MKCLNLSLLFALFLSACAPSMSAVPTATPIQTRTPTPIKTSTPVPTRTNTPTPTPKLYILRLEFSTTSDWSRLIVLDSDLILDTRLVGKLGDLTDFSYSETGLGIKQTPEDAQALKEVSITVDFFIYDNTPKKSISFLLQKGGINDSVIRFYDVFSGEKYLLLDEVYRNGYVKNHEDTNPYNFSFDLSLLFQDVAAIAARSQPEAGTGKFIFDYDKTAYENIFPDLKGDTNVFTSNWDGTDLTPVTNGLNGFNRIESISADRQMLLFSSHSGVLADGDLYLIQLNAIGPEPIRLAGGLESSRSPQAFFLDNTRIVYIGRGSQGYGFYVTNIDGTNPEKIGAPTGRVWGIVSADQTRVYWKTIQNKNFKDSFGSLTAYGDFETLWWTNIDGSGQGRLESNGQQIIGSYAFSHDGKMLAWIPMQYEPGCTTPAFYTKWITEDTYTEWAALPFSEAARHGIPEVWLGQTIDMDFVNAEVHKCFIIYVASLSELDSPTKIVLMPPANLIKGDFTFSKEYDIRWEPDGSTLLLFNGGRESYFVDLAHEPLLYYLNLMDTEPELKEYRHSLFSRTLAKKVHILDLSPNGQQILVTNLAEGPYIRILDLNALAFSDSLGNNLFPDSDVGHNGKIYWLP